jgi:hypothetical protein
MNALGQPATKINGCGVGQRGTIPVETGIFLTYKQAGNYRNLVPSLKCVNFYLDSPYKI